MTFAEAEDIGHEPSFHCECHNWRQKQRTNYPEGVNKASHVAKVVEQAIGRTTSDLQISTQIEFNASELVLPARILRCRVPIPRTGLVRRYLVLEEFSFL